MKVKECIIKELSSGVKDKAVLLDVVIKKASVTPQAVYKVIRQLVEQDVVISKNKKLSLTLWYVEAELEKWKRTLDTYNYGVSVNDMVKLRRGQKCR